MPSTASIRTLRNEYAKLVELARRGQVVTILRHGKPVARLMPPEAPSGADWAGSAAFALKQRRLADPEEVRRAIAENKGRY